MEPVNRHSRVGVEKHDLATDSQEERRGEVAAGPCVWQRCRACERVAKLRHRAGQFVGERANIKAKCEKRAGKKHGDEHQRNFDRSKRLNPAGESRRHGASLAGNTRAAQGLDELDALAAVELRAQERDERFNGIGNHVAVDAPDEVE